MVPTNLIGEQRRVAAIEEEAKEELPALGALIGHGEASPSSPAHLSPCSW